MVDKKNQKEVQVLLQFSVVPRARHCGIPAILPSVSLKNAPSAGLWPRPNKSAEFSLFKPFLYLA